MPTYEYLCRGCGERLEVVQSFSDDALTTCPTCQGELRKVFSAAGLIFKGSGWHVKDYASSGSAVATGASGASGSSTPTSTSASTSASDSGDSGGASGSGGPDRPKKKAGEQAAKPAASATPASSTGD